MIIKTLSRKSNPTQLITYATRYLLKDGAQTKEKEHMAVLIEHNLRSHSVEDYIAAFRENESYRLYPRKDNATLFHSIISFSPQDKGSISLPMLKDIGMKFVNLRGTNCLHLAVAHLEKSHAHIHVITSGVTVNGKSSRLSKAQFNNLLNELETYQQTTYPELIHSVNRHDKTAAYDKEQLIEHLGERRKTTKLLLHENLKAMLIQSQSYELFSHQLAAHNYELYYRNGNPQGIVVDNTKYRFTSIGIELTLITELQERDQTFGDLVEIRNKEILQRTLLEKKHPTQQRELQELQNIRDRSKEIDGFERVTETEYRGMGMSP